MSGKNVNANLTNPRSRSHLLSGAFLCLAVLLQFPFWGAGQAIARDRDTAHRTEESSAPWSVDSPVVPSRQTRPGIHEAQLNQQEADRYRRIFELQDATDWRAADKLIAEVTDMRLMGHVEYQRLMNPGHKATYNELRGWLERYADHAGADRVYQLALKRMARGDRKPPAPSRDGVAVPPRPQRRLRFHPRTGSGDNGQRAAQPPGQNEGRTRIVRRRQLDPAANGGDHPDIDGRSPRPPARAGTAGFLPIILTGTRRQLERRDRRLESRPERQGRQGVPGAGEERIGFPLGSGGRRLLGRPVAPARPPLRRGDQVA
jgi:hypothetical protein